MGDKLTGSGNSLYNLKEEIKPFIGRFGSDAIVEAMAEYFENNIGENGQIAKSDGRVYSGQRQRGEMLRVFAKVLRQIDR